MNIILAFCYVDTFADTLPSEQVARYKMREVTIGGEQNGSNELDCYCNVVFYINETNRTLKNATPSVLCKCCLISLTVRLRCRIELQTSETLLLTCS